MGKLILVTGGARSGKSSLALKLAKEIKKKKVFVATCVVQDEEMKERVRRHRSERPASWRTVEPGVDLVKVLKKEVDSDVVLLIDCLTLFISLLLLRGDKEDSIKKESRDLVRVILQGKATAILVSNEVGAGIVPENKLGRDFRDLAGICNQIVARSAEDVYLSVSGIALKIKGDKRGHVIASHCRDQAC